MTTDTYRNILEVDAPTAIAAFKGLKSMGVYKFLTLVFNLSSDLDSFSPKAKENLQKVIQAIAPTLPEDCLEKYYENGSSPDAFHVFEMFVDGGYHTSWQWGSRDLLAACCLSGSPKWLPRFFARQNVTPEDVPLLVLASLNPNSEMLETVLSDFDLQHAYDKIEQLYGTKGPVVSVEWQGWDHRVSCNHIKSLQENLLNRLCDAQRQKIAEEISSIQPAAARKKM